MKSEGGAKDPLQDRIIALFDAPVVVVHGSPALVNGDLFPEEREHILRAVPKRQAEFGSARAYARRALATLGYPPQALPPRPDRSPLWPEGVTGTITHCANFCAVAVARTSVARGLGLDAEPDAALDTGLESFICTPRELSWLAEQPLSEQGRLAKIFFCAKEAFYKCQYPTTGAYLDFLDVEIALEPSAGHFFVRAVLRQTLPAPLVDAVRGRFDVVDGLILAAATL